MAYDLIFRKQTNRNYSRGSRSQALTTIPSLPAVSSTPTHLDDALSRAIAANPGIMVRPKGAGAIVSKKWKWG